MNVSSNMAALGAKNLAVYAASKGGVHVLTRHLAVELAPLVPLDNRRPRREGVHPDPSEGGRR